MGLVGRLRAIAVPVMCFVRGAYADYIIRVSRACLLCTLWLARRFLCIRAVIEDPCGILEIVTPVEWSTFGYQEYLKNYGKSILAYT